MGPIGVLCIRRTLAHGRVSGLVSGLGAATADALYGSVAAFGLTFISSFLVEYQLGVRLLGGAFLLYLGSRIFLSEPSEPHSRAPGGRLAGDYLSTFALTLTNPLTILAFAAVFAGFGLGGGRGAYFDAAVMVLGVLIGSGLWWFLLTFSVGALRGRFSLRGLLWVNRISGLVILGFGAAVLLASAQSVVTPRG